MQNSAGSKTVTLFFPLSILKPIHVHYLLLELVSPVPVVRKVMNKITSMISSYI